jgi:hypothetical protein
MDHRHRNVRRLVAVALAALILALASFVVFAQTTENVIFNWTAPTEGTAAVQYFVEHSIDGGPWARVATVPTNSYELDATVGQSHRIRVAGVDSTGRQGVWSVPSEPYAPLLSAPGQPGQPYPVP